MAPTILLTRPDPSATQFAALLCDRITENVPVVSSPLLEIVYQGQLPNLSPFEGMIFTSRHGVAAFVQHAKPFAGVCYAVGDATAMAAQRAGLRVLSAGGDAQALIGRILADGHTGPMLHVRGKHSQGDIALHLSQAGCPTQEAIVYAQQEQSLTPEAKTVLNREKPVVLPLFSPRTARIFYKQHQQGAPLFIAAMSENVAKIARQFPHQQIAIARQPDKNAMLAAIEGLLDAAELLERENSGG